MAERTAVWVYGTLKRGQGNHHFLNGQEFLGEFASEPLYRLYDVGPFPGLIRDQAAGREIHGELYRVDWRCLRRLDGLEGVPYLYRRESVELQGFPEPAETYIYNGDTVGLVECSPAWEPRPSAGRGDSRPS